VLKKISLSNFHLKGSGWARDGYKKEWLWKLKQIL
jgi:hypothetical protein